MPHPAPLFLLLALAAPPRHPPRPADPPHRVAPPRVAPPPAAPPRVAPPRVSPPHAGLPLPPAPPRVAPLPHASPFGFAHPPQGHGDREGHRWLPGRGRHPGRWVPLHRPGRHWIWVPGHWEGHVWVNGHWVRPHRR